ncbi:MAG TPA: carboxypeptidase-like regulatory domain-containing protein [Gemmatimonadaceae bacterium]
MARPHSLLQVVAFALCAGVVAAVPALAQQPAAPPAQQSAPQPEVIRGRVTDSTGKALPATVIVTRGPDRMMQQADADSAGNFTVRFEEGTGDYLVNVIAPGMRSARRRVQAEGGARVLTANFVLTPDVTRLAAVQVRSARPERAQNPVSPYQQESGSSERWAQGVSGQLSPTVAGDLGALAGTMPNVTLTPTGPTMLGAGIESNLTTLNGMALSANAIPRAARTETRVSGTTYDATRGGFAGANIDVRLGPGDRFYQRRNAFGTVDPRTLQLTDAAGRDLGALSGGFRTSLGADGELIRQALTYNVAVDLARTMSDPATLLGASDNALLSAGVSPDSVARLQHVAQGAGLPFSGLGVPASRQRDAVTWLGRLDDTRDSLRQRTFTSYAGFTKEGAIGFSPLVAPTTGQERRDRTLGAQLALRGFHGAGQYVMNETRLAASQVRTETDGYRGLPGANILVRSDDVEGGAGVSSLRLGGSALPASTETRWTAEGANETIWQANGRRHRFKALAWGRVDGLALEGVQNGLGTFSYNSIADFEAGRASRFTRTLTQPERAATVWNTAAAFSHNWFPSPRFNAIYGARLEGAGSLDAPERNPALERALGVRTGVSPTRLHLSPRAGFSWTYSRDRRNGNGAMQTPAGRMIRNTTGVLRGGIGEFRDLWQPGLLADVQAATGLAGSTTTLSCVGAAVPAADWTSFAADATTIPSRCRDGGGVLGERTPAATLLSPSYDSPRSWRATLDWSTNIRDLLLQVNTLASYDLSQPGSVDANFAGVQRGTLAGEGGRPLFVSPASIDAATGALSAAESRRSAEFGAVDVRRSDLRGYGTQATFTLQPDIMKFRSRYSPIVSLSYTIQQSRRQYRGFDGAGFGDPRLVEWAPSRNDARHVFVAQAGITTRPTGTITLFTRVQSGLPFTPIVQGDVNGDGRFGDRAWIPDPATEQDASLAGQVRELLDAGSPVARQCLASSLGRAAARNGCRGPWTTTLNMQWSPTLPRSVARRLTTTFYFNNVLGGVDQLVHGAGNTRGWGGQVAPDPVLLVPRGYDAAAGRFRYDVNRRFGDTRPGRSWRRDPFRLVLDFSLNLATPFPLQELRRAIEPVKGKGGWERRSVDSLTAFYLSRTSSVHKLLLSESDSLFLTKEQVAALRRADSVYSAGVRAIYRPLAEFLSRAGTTAGAAELDSATATSRAYWKLFWQQPEVADSIITPTQRQLMPTLANMLNTPARQRETSQWQFGWPVSLDDRTPLQSRQDFRGVRNTSP